MESTCVEDTNASFWKFYPSRIALDYWKGAAAEMLARDPDLLSVLLSALLSGLLAPSCQLFKLLWQRVICHF